jgi:hypothetical protein
MPESQHATNGFDPDVLKQHLSLIDECDDELASLLGEYRASCRGPRGRIKNAMEMAKEHGLNIAALREVMAVHRAQRRIEKNIEALEADDASAFEDMARALGEFGETPLGKAALKRASGEQALDSLA